MECKCIQGVNWIAHKSTWCRHKKIDSLNMRKLFNQKPHTLLLNCNILCEEKRIAITWQLIYFDKLTSSRNLNWEDQEEIISLKILKTNAS